MPRSPALTTADTPSPALQGRKGTLPVPRLPEVPLTFVVSAALRRHSLLSLQWLSVSGTGSEVTLRGRVDNWPLRTLAEHITWAVPGVARVHNLVDVEP
ncbi:BON domain-containing protein [Nitrospirillum viridazoti]|uniref:BON domain-containing protein n=1 Tax=Nitrospirillum amazonense TaxID=28077 RepID=A0A560HRL8_9PROT|nr:BON domain-containing protein [Nitrospirillum amazonense]